MADIRIVIATRAAIETIQSHRIYNNKPAERERLIKWLCARIRTINHISTEHGRAHHNKHVIPNNVISKSYILLIVCTTEFGCNFVITNLLNQTRTIAQLRWTLVWVTSSSQKYFIACVQEAFTWIILIKYFSCRHHLYRTASMMLTNNKYLNVIIIND